MQKLEDEISKLVKQIGPAMLKDATPEDLAIMSQNTDHHSSDESEIARLRKLPGFIRLQRQLFFNLMSAKPDVSDRNVRILTINKKKMKDEGIDVTKKLGG